MRSNAQQLAESIVSALADFTDQSGTGTGVGLGGAQLSVTNQYAYKTSYEAGMWGDVKKYAIDITTGVLPVDANGNPLNAPLWSAATQLDAQAAVSGAVNGWDTQRRIVTMNDATQRGRPVPPREPVGRAADVAQQRVEQPSPSPPTAQSVLNYLRGDKSNEGINTTNFRTRSHILGDIVYSAAVPVGAPSAPYLDTGATGSPNPGYNAFKSSKASRAPMVYVGGNDGMLHAFDDTVANGGKETWAYIPEALFGGGDPNDTAHTPAPAFQLGALAFRRGGIPLFSHKFYVNATPRVWDVDFANTNTSTPPRPATTGARSWSAGSAPAVARSMRSTSPPGRRAAAGRVDATRRPPPPSKVLWEFTDANLGYVYDAPTLVKTYAYGWVVLVASGYNNPGGKGFLYVLNPNAPLEDRPAAEEDCAARRYGHRRSPTGLGTIRAFTASRQNPYVLQAYGGDLKGNVWRFDLSNADATKWKAEKIATLKDASGQGAADHDRRADRNRPEQQRRSLSLRRHGQAARSAGPRRHVGDQFHLRDQGRHADDAGAGAGDALFADEPQCGDGNQHRRFLGARRRAAAGTRTRPARTRRSTATSTRTSTSSCSPSRSRRRTRAWRRCRRRCSCAT